MVEGGFPPSTLTLFATRPTVSLCVSCQGSSYTKNEYSFFYQKFDAEYFIQQFFQKKLYFQRKPQKTVLGAFDNFLGKEGVLCRKLT